MAQIDRPLNRRSKFANIVADQQYYQMAKDALRTLEVVIHDGSIHQPLIQVPDETTWRYLNSTSQTAGIPTHFFIRGSDEIGLYPTPSGALTRGLEQVYEPRHIDFSEADTITGTVTVDQGDATIVHSSTSFTAKMAGQGFQVTDGTDREWYRVQTFTDTSNMELDQLYQGESGGGRTFRIGQVMYLPDEFLEAPTDYSMYRHYLRQNDRAAAADFKALFEDALKRIRAQYGKKTSSAIINASRNFKQYNPLTGTPGEIPT